MHIAWPEEEYPRREASRSADRAVPRVRKPTRSRSSAASARRSSTCSAASEWAAGRRDRHHGRRGGRAPRAGAAAGAGARRACPAHPVGVGFDVPGTARGRGRPALAADPAARDQPRHHGLGRPPAGRRDLCGGRGARRADVRRHGPFRGRRPAGSPRDRLLVRGCPVLQVAARAVRGGGALRARRPAAPDSRSCTQAAARKRRSTMPACAMELQPGARRFEYGPWSWPLVHAWARALDYVDDIGLAAIHQRTDRARRPPRRRSARDPGRDTPHTARAPRPRRPSSPSASRAGPGPALESALRERFGIVVRALANVRSGVRASVAFFTTEAEVDLLARRRPRARGPVTEDAMTDTLSLPVRYYRVYPRADMLGHAYDCLEPAAGARRSFCSSTSTAPRPRWRASTSRSCPAIAAGASSRTASFRRRRRPFGPGMQIVYVTNRLRSGLSAGNEWRTMSVRTHHIDVLDAWQWPNAHLSFPKAIAPAAARARGREAGLLGLLRDEPRRRSCAATGPGTWSSWAATG